MNKCVNSFQAIAPLTGQEKGAIFLKVHIFLKNWTYSSIETQYKPFQRRVSFYILKIRESCFVWAAPPLLISPCLLI
jgi:hypothetical protein